MKSTSDLLTILEIIKNRPTLLDKLEKPAPLFSSKISELYKLLNGGNVDESDVARKLGYESKADKSFLMLRNVLVDELLDILPFCNYQNEISSHNIQIDSCYRSYLSIRVMLSLSRRKAAVSQAQRLLKKVDKLQLTDLRLATLNILRENAVYEGDEQSFGAIRKQIAATLELQRRETGVEEMRQFLEMCYSEGSRSSDELAGIAREYLDTIDRYLASDDIYSFRINRFRIIVMLHDANRDYAGILQICREAGRWLDATPVFSTKARQAEFLVYGINAAYQLRDFNAAQKNAQQCMSLYKQGKHNWYVATSHYILTALCLDDYKTALEALLKAANNPSFSELKAFQKERWTILAAFAALFVEGGSLKIHNKRILQALQKAPFWGEMKLALKDKKGLNFALNVIAILFSVANKDLAEAKRKLILTRKSLDRISRKGKFPRSEQFLYLVNLLLKKQNVSSNALNKGLAELRANPTIEDVEYIPYEQLYDWLQKKLAENAGMNGRKRRKRRIVKSMGSPAGRRSRKSTKEQESPESADSHAYKTD